MTHQKNLIGIQYLRGIAALLVVMDHCSGMLGLTKYYGFSPWGNVLRVGSIGVDLFFVISGFIICYVTLAGHDLQPKVTIGNYFHRRFSRIIPFLWLSVISYGVLKYLGRGGFPLEPYFRALFLLPGGEVQPNAVWTLRHEMLFYILFSFVLVNRWWRFIPLIVWFILPYAVLPNLGQVYLGQTDSLLYFFANPVNLLFGVGVFSAFVYLKNWLPQRKIYISFCWIFLASLLLALFSFEIEYERSNLFQVPLIAIPCAVLLLLGVLVSAVENPGFVSRFGEILGDASYAIYLSHEAFISAVLGVLSKFKGIIPIEVALVFAVSISVAMGLITHIWVEKPLVEIFKPRGKG